MPKRNKKGRFTSRTPGVRVTKSRRLAGGNVVVVEPPPARTRSRSRSRRAAPAPKRRRRRSSGGSAFPSGGNALRLDLVLGAAALGFAIKQGLLDKVPRFLGMGPITNFGA